MSNVRNLRPVEPALPQWGSGEAHCVCCGHRWVAVAETGAVWLACPQCSTHKGLFTHHFAPTAGAMVRECHCGNQLFYLTPEGHMCAHCGTYQRY